jgi:hypothetical protein
VSDFYDFSDLRTGMRVQVEGTYENGVLHASSIAIKDDSDMDEMESRIDSLDAADRSMRLLGFTLGIDAAVEIKDVDKRAMPFESLEPGMRIKVKGTAYGNRFVAERIKLKMAAPDDMDEIEGNITSLDPESRTLTVMGLPVACDADVEIEA